MCARVLLVGTDISIRGDDAIVEGLQQLALNAAAVLHVVHVVEPGALHDQTGQPALLQQEQALASSVSMLRRRIQYDAVFNGLPYEPARIHVHVRIGTPVDTLLQAAVDYEADVLILGTHGQRGLQRLLLGSVTRQLLRRAHCPVLIARPTNYHGLDKTPSTSEPDGHVQSA